MKEENESIKNEEIQSIDLNETDPLQKDHANTEILPENEGDKEPKKSKLFNKSDKKLKQQNTELLKQEIDQLKADNAEIHDKFLRLYSEFDNYRKRTQKEKLDVIQNASEAIIVSLLTIIDDMERAIKYSETPNVETSSVKEGTILIFQKLNGLLKQKGLKEIEITQNALFNTDNHEAVGILAAPKEEDKGKIVEVVEKGYMLNDKVIRFSKVIIYQ
ncbi:MAG: nucleotide exchange factor GrpE [Bacteroidales bacterium]|jgi:molecular chaperone GrpE|nr:nucleotide exchange factor GrpE [Bacteroidales bacterium]